jgi:hypothetical protein
MRVCWRPLVTAERLQTLSANTAHARSLGLPYLAHQAPERPSGVPAVLNIVGRGPSVAHYLEIMRDSDNYDWHRTWLEGDVWAVGTAIGWCHDNGINATFVCADPSPIFAQPRYSVPTKRAILSLYCAPEVFHELRYDDVHVFDAEENGAGTTSAGMAICAGLIAGYTEFRLWGCEGSYAENTHADRDEPQTYGIRLRCNGQEFRTNPQMVMQSEEIADVIRAHPGMVKDHSGGLLGAMVASGGEWELLEYNNAPENIAAMLRAAE